MSDHRRLGLWIIIAFATLLLEFGARVSGAALGTEEIQAKLELLQVRCGDRLSTATRRAMAETVMVDDHTHTFNLGFLPLEEILYRYRLPEAAAKPIAALLLRLTDTTPLASPALPETGDPIESFVNRLTRRDLDELTRQEKALRKAVARDAGPEEAGFSQTVEEAAVSEPALERLAPDDRRRVGLLLQVLDRAGRGDDSSGGRGEIAEMARTEASPEVIGGRVRGFLRMAALLTLREDHITAKLRADYPMMDIFVHHMMDLDNVYAGGSTFDLDERLRRAEDLQRMSGGHLRFTVAFDPFRPKGAIDHVKRGLAAGAVGIKFYPPSGYRPSATPLPWRPGYQTSRFPFFYLPVSARKHQRTQWSSRYGQGISPVQARIEELIALALEKDVPIYSHHTPQGFEAMGAEGANRLNYGTLMADPIFWEPVLREHPQLRLVLAHSGGGDAWFGGRPWEGSFDEHAYQLCVTYPNVYCDFGFSAEVLTARGRKAFREKLQKLAARCTGVQCGERGRPTFDLRDKIIYGSDWHMVSQEKHYQDLVCAFGEVLSGGGLDGWAAGFFGDNARRALRLDK